MNNIIEILEQLRQEGKITSYTYSDVILKFSFTTSNNNHWMFKEPEYMYKTVCDICYGENTLYAECNSYPEPFVCIDCLIKSLKDFDNSGFND